MIWIEGDTSTANITTMPYQTLVRYKVVASDNANNTAIDDRNGLLYSYLVVPEFSSALIVPMFVLVTLIVKISRLATKKSRNRR